METTIEVSDRTPNGESAKALGAFYTDVQVADFLVWWAIRSPRDTVMDPSFGGGVFLRSACHRLLSLGGQPPSYFITADMPGAEQEYFLMLRQIYNDRNPHAIIGEEDLEENEGYEEGRTRWTGLRSSYAEATIYRNPS
jgi:hypothetical protein